MEKIRKEIDRLDDEIIARLTERFRLVLQLIDQKPSLTDLPRESSILAKIPSLYIQNIYREIFKNSKQMLKETLDKCCFEDR